MPTSPCPRRCALAASQIGAMPVVDVNSGTDAELILALSEAGIKLKVVRERIVELRRAKPFASMRDLAERVNALAQLPKERLGTKQLPSLRCSAPAVDVPAPKRRRLLAADMNVPSAPAPSNVQLARQIASGLASGQATLASHPPCSRAVCSALRAHLRPARPRVFSVRHACCRAAHNTCSRAHVTHVTHVLTCCSAGRSQELLSRVPPPLDVVRCGFTRRGTAV